MRTLVLALFGLLILSLAAAVGVVAGWVIPGSFGGDVTKELSAEGDVAAFGAVVLAVVGAIVALVAYAFTSGRPRLTVTITFPDSKPNEPVLPVVQPPVAGTQMIDLDATVDLTAELELTNHSKFSARNPYVRLGLVGLAGIKGNAEWLTAPGEPHAGATEIEWEGRDRSVHDRRRLPGVDFTGVKYLANASTYRIELRVAAEGFAHTFAVPVQLLDRRDWNRHMATKSDVESGRWKRLKAVLRTGPFATRL